VVEGHFGRMLAGSIPASLMVTGNSSRSFIVRIDMGLTNETLWAGCSIIQVGGRENLVTVPSDAIEIIGANVRRMLAQVTDHEEVTLTGPMAIWSYLVVFHAVVHKFIRVYYDDGKGSKTLIAQHGA